MKRDRKRSRLEKLVSEYPCGRVDLVGLAEQQQRSRRPPGCTPAPFDVIAIAIQERKRIAGVPFELTEHGKGREPDSGGPCSNMPKRLPEAHGRKYRCPQSRSLRSSDRQHRSRRGRAR